MIILSTVTANASGVVRIRESPSTSLYDLPARVSRTATLDGGCLITHTGVSDGDRTLDIRTTELSESEMATLKTLYESETLFVLSCREGCFEGVIENLKADPGNVQLQFLVRVSLT